jgi:lipoate-protein ligase A
MPPAAVWRWIIDGSASAAWNMAVDEALLDGAALGSPLVPPTLRLYGWRPAALSLGSRQPLIEAALPRRAADQGVDLVRRPTGGGAVFHDRERTYAVIGRLAVPPFQSGVVANYGRIAAALAQALRALGVAVDLPDEARAARRIAGVCFESLSAHEIAVRGRKLVGSAQLRRRGAFLQHGSIPLALDVARMERAWGHAVERERLTDLETVLGREIPGEEIDRELRRAFASAFGARLEPSSLTPAERARAERYVDAKYARNEWTIEGRASAA